MLIFCEILVKIGSAIFKVIVPILLPFYVLKPYLANFENVPGVSYTKNYIITYNYYYMQQIALHYYQKLNDVMHNRRTGSAARPTVCVDFGKNLQRSSFVQRQ